MFLVIFVVVLIVLVAIVSAFLYIVPDHGDRLD